MAPGGGRPCSVMAARAHKGRAEGSSPQTSRLHGHQATVILQSPRDTSSTQVWPRCPRMELGPVPLLESHVSSTHSPSAGGTEMW